MTFTILFKVGPSGMFGLPQEGVVVFPGGKAQNVVGPTLDSRSGEFVAHGTLSEYRPDDAAVRFSGEIAGRPLTARDNFFWLQVEATDRGSALRDGTARFERFLRLLSLDFGNAFSYEIVHIESADGQVTVRPGPQAVKLITMTVFDTARLQERIASAAHSAALDDPQLTKALLYREHAALLFELRTGVGLFSPHFAFLLTSAFLNMWKAITAILGEPGTDSDYQSRFLEFGLPGGYWQNKVKRLQDVRNDFDVAHYSLDEGAVGRVEESFAAAGQVCREVIVAYIGHLARSAAPVTK